MRNREHFGVIYWRMWGGFMLAFTGVLFATDFDNGWPWWCGLAFAAGVSMIFDALARTCAQVHRYATASADRR